MSHCFSFIYNIGYNMSKLWKDVLLMKNYEKHIKVCVGTCLNKCKYCSKIFHIEGTLKCHISSFHEEEEVS